MVKDHSDSEKGNPLPLHRLLLLINSKGSFICTIPHRTAHTMAFVTPVMDNWPEREIAQWVHPMKDHLTSHHTMSEHSYHGATIVSEVRISERGSDCTTLTKTPTSDPAY